MKATTRRGGAGGLPAAKKKKKKKPARGFMCGCGGAKSVSTVSRAAVSISAVTTTPMKATSTAASAAKPASSSAAKTAAGCHDAADADASAEGSPSVDSLLRQLRELERGVRALGVREREGGGGGSAPRATRPRRHGRSASDWGGIGRLESESVAVVTESEDPLGDFRRSMVQMIVENGITGGAELRELLQRFLSLNAACHHHLILRAFADVWEELFAGGGHAPPPLPAAEKISSSYSSRASNKRPHARPALTR
ncbi:hypothetical protein PAHAL_9G623800 [Panicum hallii]|jgi:uncharacterized protein (TIGR01568 family)|uniref:Transcription repressor n=1 Tax=Panicum hallii TaxID=206008 RepID=A0A2S3IUS3_9POAL|nr:transcription repressor OFP8-like [Panicum hallii]PAN51840.1 hypothetical protein PAHAL_9G623800 [Panicum hallii]